MSNKSLLPSRLRKKTHLMWPQILNKLHQSFLLVVTWMKFYENGTKSAAFYRIELTLQIRFLYLLSIIKNDFNSAYFWENIFFFSISTEGSFKYCARQKIRPISQMYILLYCSCTILNLTNQTTQNIYIVLIIWRKEFRFFPQRLTSICISDNPT